MRRTKKEIVWFKGVDKDDVGLVGGKGANLGEMVRAGFPVPPGFIVTAEAYYRFLKENKLEREIKRLLQPANLHDPRQLNTAAKQIKQIIIKGKVPEDLAVSVIKHYEKLTGRLKPGLVAVRSSATAEDLPDASFAGQQETFLNIKGEANLVDKIRESWASLFTPRAIFYRQEKNFNHFKVGIAVVVQKMIQSDCSGVIFTVDPVTNNKRKIIIEAIYGLGELIVQGSVTPDHYEVNRQTFRILKKDINRQSVQLIKSGTLNKKTKVKVHRQKKQKINDKQIVHLAKLAKKIQQHYFFPQDIEWGIEKKKAYILQSRPITTLDKEKNNLSKSKIKKLKKIKLPLILKGDPASPGVAAGQARIIKSAKEISKVKEGEILVTQRTTPDFVPAMKRTAGIITDQGGQTSHAAIVSRELGIPCIVGTDKGSKVIKNNWLITLDGQTGQVFKGGSLEKSILIAKGKKMKKTSLEKKVAQTVKDATELKTATKLYLNLADPESAEKMAGENVDGIGLLRAEFMISEKIKYHPKKLNCL